MQKSPAIFLILVVIACLLPAGCTLASGNSSVPPPVPAAAIPTSGAATPVPAAASTAAPLEVVTVVRYVSLPKDIKDSGLLFMLQVPAEWNVSTCRMMNADTADYRTDLVAGNAFSIYSYPSTRSREQAYREQFRQWSPAPVETTVSINNIRYDRFESRAGGNTTVAYLAYTNSANERGYASVLVFVAHDSNRFEREDFEKVVSSFRYFSGRSANTIPGADIPLYDPAGNALSRNAGGRDSMMFNSSDWDTAEAGSLGGDSLGESTPAGGSTGGGCGR